MSFEHSVIQPFLTLPVSKGNFIAGIKTATVSSGFVLDTPRGKKKRGGGCIVIDCNGGGDLSLTIHL